MARIRLIHWNGPEGRDRGHRLADLGHQVDFDDLDLFGKPTAQKLGVKPGARVCLLGAPKGFATSLEPLPPRVTFTARPEAMCELFLVFVRSRRDLSAQFAAAGRVIDRQPMWIIWPKKASGINSDVDGNVVREMGLAGGWVDYKVCSVDEIWSGYAFKRRR